jgi:hypothetical protein
VDFTTSKEISLLFVEVVGYAPTPPDFQSGASTKLASPPYVKRTI